MPQLCLSPIKTAGGCGPKEPIIHRIQDINGTKTQVRIKAFGDAQNSLN